MDFADQIRELAAKLDTVKGNVATEEATKTSMVMPFLQVMGYDVFDPMEVIPEFKAELKKGEKVDFAIFIKDKDPKIIIEVKSVRTNLEPKAKDQLVGYFYSVTRAEFAIITNGIQYQFYSESIDKNKILDANPFLIVNIVPSISDQEIAELHRFHKSSYNFDNIIAIAKRLKFEGELKRYFRQQFKNPDDSFIKFLIQNTSFSDQHGGGGHRIITKATLAYFKPIIHSTFKDYVKEAISETLQEVDKAIKPDSKEGAPERDNLRFRFWTQLLAYSKTKTDLHSRITPGQDSWCGMGAGTSGLGYNYVIFQHHARVELYIDKGNNDLNKGIFDRLAAAKGEIEKSFGEPLEWERKDEKRACRVKKDLTLGGYRDDEQVWPKIQEAMVDAMIRLHAALSPHIQYLKK
ncbi:MAG: DUF4268 domain-containing protein [Desulfobaccales bacterium]